MAITIKQTRVVDVPVTELRAAMDVACVATLLDAEGVVVGQSTTPTWLPQVLQIDLESGRIINWRAPTGEQLQAMADCQEVIPTMPADMVDVCEKYMPQMTNLVDVSHPATNAPATAQPVDVVAPVQAVAVETAPESQQPKIIDIELPADFAVESVVVADPVLVAEPVAKKLSVDIGVSFNKETGRWVADVGNDEVGEHSATSQQGKFEAIKNVLKKAGLLGVYEINKRDWIDDVEFYSYDGSRTLDADTVYVTKGADGWVAKTPSNRPVAGVISINGELTALLKEMEGIKPEDAVIIETTDDEMRSKGKRRYAVTAKSEHMATQNDPVEAEDIGGRGAVKPRYQSPTTGETWTGRGKQPAWLQAEIAAGANINDFLIPTALLKKPLEIVPTPEPVAPPTYTEVMAAIEYAATEIHAAKLVNTINAGGFDFDQRTRLHAALNTRIKQIKAAEPA